MDLRDAEGHDIDAVLAQPKRLALLAYLALTTAEGYQRRDLLLPIFWPELPEAGARNALRQALHQIRRSLGNDAIVARGADALTLASSVVWCDASAFAAAVTRGSYDEALALYAGDFLPGFAIESGSSDFDRWLDDTRVELRRQAVQAAWASADLLERSRNSAGAVAAARRAVALAGDDEAALRKLLSLLDRAGDRTAVEEAYADFERRLMRDTGRRPSRETTILIDALRKRPLAQGSITAPPAVSKPRAREHVIVGPFENLSGDVSADFIGRLMTDAIAQGLLESRLVDVATSGNTPRDADDRVRSGLSVAGSYFLRDDVWRFQIRIMEQPGGRILETFNDLCAPLHRPWDAADDVRRRVSGMLSSRLDPRFASWANAVAQAPTPEAHRELALGAELHLLGDFRAAIPHFLRAGKGKEGFALPMLWAVQASCNLEEWEQAEAFLAELTSLRDRGRLSPFEKMGCDYLAACLDGQRGTALKITRSAAELLPGTEVLSWLGREALFCNQPRAAVKALEQLDPERGWIGSWTPHWRRLTEAYHMLGDHARELAAARRGRTYHPEAVSAVLYEARAHAALGDVAQVQRCLDEACALPSDRFADAGDLMLDASRELRAHGHARHAADVAKQAQAWYEEGVSEDRRSRKDRVNLARVFYELEKWDDAGVLVAELATTSPDDIPILGFSGAIAARLGKVAEARAVLSELRSKTGKFRFGVHLVCSARIYAILGENEEALKVLRGAIARGHCYGVELHSDTDLGLLNGEPSFRELLRPKG